MTQIALLSMAQLMPDEAMTVVEPQAAPVPSAADVARFEAAMLPTPVVGEAPAALPAPSMVEAMDNPATLGDRILAGVDAMRADYRKSIAEMNESMTTPRADPSMQVNDALRIYVEVLRLTMSQEMLGKLVGKSTQNLETLLKGQ
jgi:type III secretion protein I